MKRRLNATDTLRQQLIAHGLRTIFSFSLSIFYGVFCIDFTAVKDIIDNNFALKVEDV